MRLGILLSGRGSNFEAIADAGFEIAVVISNKKDAPGLEAARRRGLTALTVSFSPADAQLIQVLREHKVNLICLAGYMRLLSPEFVAAFRGKVLNIHPSLLPAFPGLHAQRQALEYGVKISGCTVHWVTEQMDAGPIVMQAAVPVEEGDTEESLSARILREEHRIYPEAIRLARCMSGLPSPPL